MEGHYDEALTEFRKLENNPAYFKLIPYYQVQINFAKGSYQEVLDQGAPLLAKAPDDRKIRTGAHHGHLLLPIGAQYSRPTDLIDKYFKGKEISRADCYVAGFCYEKLTGPIWPFSGMKISPAERCYLSGHLLSAWFALYEEGEKQKGLQAFQHASEMKFNPKIRQDALFQYAKAAYELDYSPFNESIKALDKYIAEYPGS